MNELKVRMTNDASSFNKTLQMAKNDVAKFNQQLISESKIAAKAAQNQMKAVSGGKQALGGFGMLASNAATMAGEGPIGQAIGKTNQVAQNAVILGIGMKQAADGLKGLSEKGTIMAGLAAAGGLAKKALVGVAGALGVFGAIIGAGIGALWMVKEKIKMLDEEMEQTIRTSRAESDTKTAYIKVLKDNKDKLKAGEYERLRRGVLTGDKGAMAEIRGKFGGTKLNKELQKELVRAQIEAMPAGAERDLAMERMKFDEQVEALRERVGPSPSQATQAIAAQINSAMVREYQNRVAEIQKRQLDALKEIEENTKQNKINPFR